MTVIYIVCVCTDTRQLSWNMLALYWASAEK